MALPSTHCSKNLTWEELRCKDGTEYPHAWRKTRAVGLARVFEELRAAVGLPLVILSGYRTPAHNRKIGGAPQSQHVQGRALDLLPPKGWDVEQLAAVARDIDEIMGMGLYTSFLHIDVRPGDRLAVWRGARVQADVEAFR